MNAIVAKRLTAFNLSNTFLYAKHFILRRLVQTMPRIQQIPSKMSAWQINRYGAELTQTNSASVPIVRLPDHVLVQVHAASVNPFDVMMIGKVLISNALYHASLKCFTKFQAYVCVNYIHCTRQFTFLRTPTAKCWRPRPWLFNSNMFSLCLIQSIQSNKMWRMYVRFWTKLYAFIHHLNYLRFGFQFQHCQHTNQI